MCQETHGIEPSGGLFVKKMNALDHYNNFKAKMHTIREILNNFTEKVIFTSNCELAVAHHKSHKDHKGLKMLQSTLTLFCRIFYIIT